MTREGRTSSKKHVKKLHSILRYVESSRRFTEIKQVSARSIQVCWGSVGFNAWNTFVLRVEYPYIVRKLEKSLDVGELTRKLHVGDCSRKPKCIFSFSAVNYYLKPHKKHSIKAAAHGIRWFYKALHHQISECTWACPNPPWPMTSHVQYAMYKIIATNAG